MNQLWWWISPRFILSAGFEENIVMPILNIHIKGLLHKCDINISYFQAFPPCLRLGDLRPAILLKLSHIHTLCSFSLEPTQLRNNNNVNFLLLRSSWSYKDWLACLGATLSLVCLMWVNAGKLHPCITCADFNLMAQVFSVCQNKILFLTCKPQ